MPQTTSDLPEQKPSESDDFFVTNPVHGGKITCHKCNGFIKQGEHFLFVSCPEGVFPDTDFHEECFNPYEHYYGLDRPID